MLFTELPRCPKRAGPLSTPILGSIAAHGIFFLWLFAAPLPKRASAYDQMIRPQETHLVWYNFKEKLPDVSPARAAQNKPLRAEVLQKQTVISAPVDAPQAPQMIFQPAPELKPQPVVPLPNLIALAAPPPPRRAFVPPREIARPREAAKVAEPVPAPELQPKVSVPPAVKMPAVVKLFVPPVEQRLDLTAKVQTAKVEIAPAPPMNAPPLITASPKLSAPAAKAIDQGSRMLAFRPQQKPSVTASVGELPDAPVLPGATSSNANIAIVGLNAVDNLDVPLPAGWRQAQFSGGPKLNPDGAASAGKSSGITVPDLFVRGGEHGVDRDAQPSLLARTMSPTYNSPTSLESIRASRELERASHGTGADPEISRPIGTRVSGAPDPRFLGRQVFSVAIQSPNLTSHEGSWLMWYADRSPVLTREVLSSPEPIHKVDPKYVPTAVEDRIEGVVRLAFVIGHDGHVYGVETVKGIDDRLDQSATEALRKWTFTPATRDGQAVDVDALVEIPFRLAPVTPR